MTDVNLYREGPPDTVLAPEPDDALAALDAAARRRPIPSPRSAPCVRPGRPSSRHGPSLGDAVDEPALAYAAYRTGYHRGLDRLRASGWRGSGYVRWRNETNRGFLRALSGLQRMAAQIGETEEDERCALFLRQLDPDWPPAE